LLTSNEDASHRRVARGRACPSGGPEMPLLPDGRSHRRGWEDGQTHKNAGPVVRDPARAFQLD
jgi:hypothetical protein